jgi:multiple sugar transport system permease protein
MSHKRTWAGAALRTLLLALLALPFLGPLLWLAASAFTPARQLYSFPPRLPDPPTLDNLRAAWGLLDFPRFIANSLLIAGLAVLGSLLSASLVGFAFASLPGRGKRLLFGLLLTTLALPASVTLIPLFGLFSAIGWVNTYLPLVVPYFCANGFYVFLFRQFFRGLPAELFESAELDGCNPLLAYWHIALPLCRPALAAVGVLSFIGAWNDFLGPLIYLSTTEKFTLSLGLALFQGLHYTQVQYLMPMSLVALLPALLAFFIAGRYLAPEVLVSGEKRSA